MKKSELRKVILEEMKGYSKYAQGGETKGGTTDDFRNILTAIAKQGQVEDEPQDEPEIKEDAVNPTLEDFLTKWLIPILERGVGRDLIKPGFKDMIVREINDRLADSQETGETLDEGKSNKTMSKSQVISYVSKLDPSVKVFLPRINAGGFDKQVSQSHSPEAAAKALKATKNTGTFELWQDTDKAKKFSLKISPEETKSHEKSVTNKD